MPPDTSRNDQASLATLRYLHSIVRQKAPFNYGDAPAYNPRDAANRSDFSSKRQRIADQGWQPERQSCRSEQRAGALAGDRSFWNRTRELSARHKQIALPSGEWISPSLFRRLTGQS